MPKSTATSAFELLIDPAKIEPAPLCAIVGDASFLQREVCRALARRLGGEGDESTADVIDGETAELRDVLDALRERSLFGSGRRVVVIENADALVKLHRAALEDYAARPAADATLILEVSTWPANTRLAKAVAAGGLTVRCQAPAKPAELKEFTRDLKKWLAVVAKREFGCQLEKAAAEQLLDLVPPDAGVVYQEIAKLSLLAENGVIDGALVRDHVGGWRTRQTWDMIDAAADGRAAEALEQLDRLLAAGDDPHALLPQIASTLRRFAMAVEIIQHAEQRRVKVPLRTALQQAGVMSFKLGDAERQLRQMGRARASQLYEWLLAADLQIKDYNSAKERARRVLETLVFRLSQQAAASR